MGDVKPWQIVVIVAACVLGVASLVYTLSRKDGVDVSGELTLVDVTTGQLWVASVKNRGISIPAANPETGALSLVSVFRDEEGHWIAGARDLQAIATLGVKPTVVDTKTGQVNVVSDSPKRLR